MCNTHPWWITPRNSSRMISKRPPLPAHRKRYASCARAQPIRKVVLFGLDSISPSEQRGLMRNPEESYQKCRLHNIFIDYRLKNQSNRLIFNHIECFSVRRIMFFACTRFVFQSEMMKNHHQISWQACQRVYQRIVKRRSFFSTLILVIVHRIVFFGFFSNLESWPTSLKMNKYKHV